MTQHVTMTIELSNLTEPQKLAIEDMMRTWVSFGSMGCSRWTAFYADGDGNFRPKITVDGKKPEYCKLIDRKRLNCKVSVESKPDSKSILEYAIDFDMIAWKLRDNPSLVKGKGEEDES